MKNGTVISLATGCLIAGALAGTYAAPECRNSSHEKVLENNKLYLSEMNNMSNDIDALMKELSPYIKEKENKEKYQQRVEQLQNKVEFLIENDPWFKYNVNK